MTIEIDDAGTGDLVGSAWIVLWRRELNQVIKREIPLSLYQSENFNELTKAHARDMILEALTELDAAPTEEIYLCTGSIFDYARQYLREHGYNIINSQIIGYLQDLVEQTYIDHLIEEFHVPPGLVTKVSGQQRFYALFNWVTDDYPRRVRYVKCGFGKWKSKWDEEAHSQWLRKMVEPRNREIIKKKKSKNTAIKSKNHSQTHKKQNVRKPRSSQNMKKGKKPARKRHNTPQRKLF